jgi:hypothetical protein
MARAYTGPFRAKSDPKLIRKARQLKKEGLTMRQIAEIISKEHPELGGISAATASYWSKGEIAK